MPIQPNPSFPLLQSDQADVMRIFLELKQERDREGQVSFGPANSSSDSFFPGDAFDYE